MEQKQEQEQSAKLSRNEKIGYGLATLGVIMAVESGLIAGAVRSMFPESPLPICCLSSTIPFSLLMVYAGINRVTEAVRNRATHKDL